VAEYAAFAGARGSVAVVMVRLGFTVRVTGVVFVLLCESVTVTWMVDWPDVVGVPLRYPP
jgi:hypothetical protein